MSAKTGSTDMHDTRFLPDEAATRALAADLATLARVGDCICLSGDLGAGKTSFARGFIHRFLPEAEVLSPTFTLVQHYDVSGNSSAHSICHADLYRMEHEDEFAELGLDDAWENSITLIEWPERAKSYLPADRLTIALTEEKAGRRVRFSTESPDWNERLKTLFPR